MCYDLEQVVAGGVVQAGKPEFVEHQKIQALQAAQPAARCPVGQRGVEVFYYGSFRWYTSSSLQMRGPKP